MSVRQLSSAFDALGVRASSPNNPNEWCAEGTVLLTAEAMAGVSSNENETDYLLCGGLFSLVFADHFSRLADAEMEIVASIALQAISSGTDDYIDSVVTIHNELAQTAPQLLELIGRPCANWVQSCSESDLAKIPLVFSEFHNEFTTS